MKIPEEELRSISTENLLAIRSQRNTEDDYDGLIVSILYSRNAINTCDNCKWLRSKMKFDCKRYECRYRGCRSKPTAYVCKDWEERGSDYNDHITLQDRS